MQVLWRWIPWPGHEHARLEQRDPGWYLEGASVFAHEGQPVRLDYRVVCDARYQTRSAKVEGWVGERRIEVAIERGADGTWRMNGETQPAVAGCIDVDLNFSPSTNWMPIRRLGAETGSRLEVRAAWLRFPSFALEPLDQIYTRASETDVRYESGAGKFTALLRVDACGLVLDYPGVWAAEATFLTDTPT